MVVNIFSNNSFADVRKAYVRLVAVKDGRCLVKCGCQPQSSQPGQTQNPYPKLHASHVWLKLPRLPSCHLAVLDIRHFSDPALGTTWTSP